MTTGHHHPESCQAEEGCELILSHLSSERSCPVYSKLIYCIYKLNYVNYDSNCFTNITAKIYHPFTFCALKSANLSMELIRKQIHYYESYSFYSSSITIVWIR